MKYLFYCVAAPMMIVGILAFPYVMFFNRDLAPVGMVVVGVGLALSRLSGDPKGWK